MLHQREDEFVRAFQGDSLPAEHIHSGLFPNRPSRVSRKLVNASIQMMHTSKLGLSNLVFVGAPVWNDSSGNQSESNLYKGAGELESFLDSVNILSTTGIFLKHHDVSPFLGAQLTHCALAVAKTYVADIRMRPAGAGILAETELCQTRGVPVVWLVNDEAYDKLNAGDARQNHLPSYSGWSSTLVTNEQRLPEMLFRLSNLVDSGRDYVFGGRAVPERVNYMITSFLFNYAERCPEFLEVAEKATGYSS